jgi:hypothetical protein
MINIRRTAEIVKEDKEKTSKKMSLQKENTFTC